jgi:16S rRNA G966 N2-methylase RsmD
MMRANADRLADDRRQAPLFDELEVAELELRSAERLSSDSSQRARSGTFADNMRLPVHRWFRYSAGFSAEWVESVVRAYAGDRPPVVLDPFAGSGTTVIAAASAGATAVGFESHPFVARIASAKLMWAIVQTDALREAAIELVRRAATDTLDGPADRPALLLKCYAPDVLASLEALRNSFLADPPADAAVEQLIWLALTTILRECSHVGTAQWQYVLPNKRKARTSDPLVAFRTKIADMASDIDSMRQKRGGNRAQILFHDARDPSALQEHAVDLVVTSPPYPNNYDYADATRLEMTFWGEIESWGDLQDSVRKHIVRSCSQHSAAERLALDDLLSSPSLKPIVDELGPVCRQLEQVRTTKGGKKTYHTMVAAYFVDLARVLEGLRKVCRPGSRLCLVVGDSAPYGVHVPVERWLAGLASATGFGASTFEKLRDRNVKWKNRKHRVPLHEGRLWIEG